MYIEKICRNLRESLIVFTSYPGSLIQPWYNPKPVSSEVMKMRDGAAGRPFQPDGQPEGRQGGT
jgi:hypothetical protein